eukprot:TRINITY_DN37643_c0_g1_i1.p1 TRINITY_DN37643_c0_g1~~TRINITY_DN37643_c0_g1_i1.p1  ORF type:complete len:594 (-),score=65.57 TRINITY_DN37643_c0_g1_i1:81-1805(-)
MGALPCLNRASVVRMAGDIIEEHIDNPYDEERYHRSPDRLRDKYVVQSKVLGCGMSGAVHLGTNRETDQHVAVKTLGFTLVQSQARRSKEIKHVVREVELMLSTAHPHIVYLLDVFESSAHIHLVMEYLGGGTLVSCITMQTKFLVDAAASVSLQMLYAIGYLHERHIVHRDLKADNFVFEGPGDGEGFVKLIDFGLSKVLRPGKRITRCSGSLPYQAPEVLKQSYTETCDLWSLGVIVFFMIMGHLPFRLGQAFGIADIPRVEDKLRRQILSGRFEVDDEAYFASLPSNTRDFVKGLLSVDAAKRPNAAEALRYPWLESLSPSPCEARSNPVILEVLAQRAACFPLARACLALIVWRCCQEQEEDESVDRQEETYKRDEDDDESPIALPSVSVVLDRSRFRDERRQQLLALLIGARPCTSFGSQLLMEMQASGIVFTEKLVFDAFWALDDGNKTYITANDLRQVLGNVFLGIPIETMLGPCSCMNYSAFLALMCSGSDRISEARLRSVPLAMMPACSAASPCLPIVSVRSGSLKLPLTSQPCRSGCSIPVHTYSAVQMVSPMDSSLIRQSIRA